MKKKLQEYYDKKYELLKTFLQKCRFVSSETIYFPLPEIKSFSICQTEIFKTYMSARQTEI